MYEFSVPIMSPCNVGDTVWCIKYWDKKHQNPYIYRRYVSAIYVSDGFGFRTLKYPSYVVLRLAKGDRCSARMPMSEFGKTIFLSLEDAKKLYPNADLRYA